VDLRVGSRLSERVGLSRPFVRLPIAEGLFVGHPEFVQVVAELDLAAEPLLFTLDALGDVPVGNPQLHGFDRLTRDGLADETRGVDAHQLRCGRAPPPSRVRRPPSPRLRNAG
jgi:hypothetical protein